VKRKLALGFLAFLLLAVGGALALLSTPWAGRNLCALAEDQVRRATGMELELGACRIRPLRLEVQVDEVRIGPPKKPIFEADQVTVRLAPLQALSRRVYLEDVSAIRPRLTLVLPARKPGEPPAACPPPILEQFHVRRLQVEDGTADLSLPGGERVIVGRVDVHTRSEWRPDLGSLASGGRRSRVTVSLGPTLVEAGGRQTLLEEGSLDADFAFDMSRLAIREFHVQGEGVRVGAKGTVNSLCNPRLGLEVSAEAPLPAIFSLLRARGVRSDGTAAVQVHLSGPLDALDAAGELTLASARINAYSPGDARARFRVKGQQVEVPSLEVPFSGGGSIAIKASLQLGSQPTVQAEAQLRQVQFAELVARFGLNAARVMMKIDALAKVQGPLKPLRLTGEVAADATDFRVIDHSWETWKPGESTILDLPRGRIEAPVVVTVDGVEMREGSRVFAGDDVLGVRGNIFFDDARGFHLALEGGADLSALRHIASVPMAGHAQFQGTVEAAPYGPPRVEGSVRAHAFHFLELDLGEMSASALATPDLVLRVRDGVGRKGETRYGLETAVDLGASPIRVLPSRATAQGRMKDLFDIVLPWLPPVHLFQEAIDGAIQIEMPFQGPVPRVDMGFEGTLGKGTLWGRAFDSGRISARVEKGERGVIDHAELRRASARATGGGTVEFKPPSPWDLQVAFTGLELAGLDLPGDRWTGTAAGEAAFTGSVEEPVIRVSGSGEGLGVLGVPIGAVQAGGTVRGRALTLSISTGGVNVTGKAILQGAMPYEAEAEMDVEDLTRFLPGGPPAGLRAQAKGRASARGTLEAIGDSAARLELSRIRVGYADFRVNNKDPVVVAVDRRRLEVQSFTLQGTNTEFGLTGKRERDGALDFAASGSLDLRLLGGLVPALTRTHGQLTVDAAVSGTFDEPLIVGSGRIAEGGFRLKELPIEFAEMAGDLSFSQNLVVFERLNSTLNGGPTRLRGELALSRFVPVRVRVEGELDRVPMKIPSYLPTVVSGQLEAYGSPEAMTLAGTLHVLSAKYTERFELEKRILQLGGTAKRVDTRPYDPSGEWLRFDIRLVVDGDARIDNDLVRGQARGELLLTGTLAGFGMIGNLSMLPGGRAFYRGNEFSLTRAVLDFTDRTKIRIGLDVTGESTARSQNVDYRVFLHLTGDLDDPRLLLSSSPALSQQDIITLLSLGYTSRDVNAGGAIGTVATAAAAQALFAVSGLEQQLRRFVPETGVFQDVSVRLTSAYSKTSLTVEPRWEFETKAIDSRLRIRYQAPLSNQTRGQKAQVEYRLSDRASVQMQWDNDNIDVSGGDLGGDFKLRWEWSD